MTRLKPGLPHRLGGGNVLARKRCLGGKYVDRRLQQIASDGETVHLTQRGQELSPAAARQHQEELAAHSLTRLQVAGCIADQIGLG